MSQFYADGMTIRPSFHVLYNVTSQELFSLLFRLCHHHFLGYIITAIFDRCPSTTLDQKLVDRLVLLRWSSEMVFVVTRVRIIWSKV